MGIEVLRVPEESPIDLHLRLEAVVEGVLVSGTARATVEGECVRCLDPVTRPVEVELQELYLYEPQQRTSDDEELPALSGDLLDITAAVRDAIVLALPLKPLCEEDCPGLCAECGERLAEDPGHAHEQVDARWAALVGLLENSGGPSADSAERGRQANPVDQGVDTSQER